MTENLESDAFVSVSEIAANLRNMSAADLVRIRQISKLRAVAMSEVTWEDLLNESFRRALEGTRRCPRSVPLIAFLAQTIRSLASEEARRVESSNTVREVDLGTPDGEIGGSLDDLAVNLVHPEREASARSSLTQIEAFFADDAEALKVIHSLAEGRAPSEAQKDAGMTATQYASTQRRIRRRLSQFLDKEAQ